MGQPCGIQPSISSLPALVQGLRDDVLVTVGISLTKLSRSRNTAAKLVQYKMKRQPQAGTKKGYRPSAKNRALSWVNGLLKELRVPVAQAIEFTSRFIPRTKSAGLRRTHVAAICYRLQDDQIHFLLVRTRAGRWTFPKGHVDNDPSRAAAAAREAYEEAGVFGRVESQPICDYVHSKQAAFADEHLVDAHLCEVVRMVAPEEGHRTPTWFEPEKAKRRLCENRKRKYGAELSRVVDHALEHIARRHPRTI